MKRNDIGDSYVLGCSSGSLRGGKRWALAHSFIIVQLESWLAAAKRVHRSRIAGIRPSPARSIGRPLWAAGRSTVSRAEPGFLLLARAAASGVKTRGAAIMHERGRGRIAGIGARRILAPLRLKLRGP